MGRGRKITKEMAKKLQAERNRGKSCAWVAEEYGIDEKIVSKHTCLPKRGRGSNKSYILVNKHLTTKELMEKTGCGASYINATIARANIESAMKEEEKVDKEYREQVKKICKEQKKLEKAKELHYKEQLKEEKKRLKDLWGGVVKIIE